MSHFTCLVLGENPEEQLKPFDESLKSEWIDKTEEYKEEYETKETQEFYCTSSSSWGQQITKELFDFIRNNKVGAVKVHAVEKQGFGVYFKNNATYGGYYALEGGKRCEDTAWFKVTSINKTTHPDKEVCFEGEITIQVIDPPKEILVKDKYPDYETYLKEWQGVKDITKQGYWKNPNAKWDWYELGGRWTGMLKLKEGAFGMVGKPGLQTENAKHGFVDSTKKSDIDFNGMQEKGNKESAEAYDNFLIKYEADKECKKFHPYFEFGIKGETVNGIFIPETKEQYVQRHSNFVTLAVLKDGQWYERGEMGWWGTISNEKPDEEWDKEFNNLLNDLPADTLLSVYDCHI